MQNDETVYVSDEEAKEMIVEIGRRIYNRGFVASNDGNISVLVGENELWATPTGVSKGFMTKDMLVKTDLAGNILEGNRRPSSEIKMHYRVYQENKDAMSVVHAHPPVATAFAAAGRALDRAYLTEGVLQLGVVPLTPYAMPTTEEVPESIATYCREYHAMLLANHGALTWGRDALEAWRRMEAVEYCANATYIIEQIAEQPKSLTKEQVEQLIEIRSDMGITTGGIPI